MGSNSLRVLTIAHNAVAASNRARTDALRSLPDVEVTLLTPPWWYEEGRRLTARANKGWRVGSTLFTGNGTRYLYIGGLLEAIRSVRPDVIDLYEEPFSAVALETLVLRDLFAPNAAFLFYSAVNVDRRWRWPYRAIEKFVVGRADGAYVPNSDVPGILRNKGMKRQPISVVPLGVDVDRFGSALPMELEIPRPRIGFVGRFEPVKGLDVLLDAFQRINSTASLMMVGDGSEKWRLKGERVSVLPSVGYEHLPALLKALDVLVLPSVTILPMHREQFGRALVEAMAAGVPVIGSSSGAIPEVIGDAGLVVPERDEMELAKAIDAVLSDAELRRTLIERGRLRARTNFSWPVVATKTLELFRSALAYRRGAVGLEAARA